jgi:hypothetical protein
MRCWRAAAQYSRLREEYPVINVLRSAILAADPAIIETEKWNSPNFEYHGVDRVTLRIHPKGGIQVILHRGALTREDTAQFHFDDPTGLVEWRAPDRGVIPVADTDEAVAISQRLTALVRDWIAV